MATPTSQSLVESLRATGFRPFASATPYRADFWIGERGPVQTLVEVKYRVRASRGLREALYQLASVVASQEGLRGYLVLVEPQIGWHKTVEVWADLKVVVKASIFARLGILVLANGERTYLPPTPIPALNAMSDRFFGTSRSLDGERLSPPSFFYEILRVLVRNYLLREPAVTRRWLAETVGCSYPTVASALESLGSYLSFGRNRAVELARFPDTAWRELLILSQRERQTRLYTDRSGQPRSPSSLMQRLIRLGLENVGVSGTIAAKRRYPGLDVHGTPRLDLVVHCPEHFVDLGFVRKLDPALSHQSEPSYTAPVSLAIHVLRRKVSFFERHNGVQYADPVESLLDLHELLFDSQAAAFIEKLRAE